MFCDDFPRLRKTLEQRGYTPHFAATPQEARDMAVALIRQGKSVGLGGSMTLAALGMYEALCDAGLTVYSHAVTPRSQDPDIFQKENTADWYLASSNAITLDGMLINIDGVGNRVAGMFAGPKQVCLIIGRNKVAQDLVAGLDRARNVAAPLNARRLHKQTPCTLDSRCHDCSAPQRICRVTSIIEYKPLWLDALHLILVDADLGY